MKNLLFLLVTLLFMRIHSANAQQPGNASLPENKLLGRPMPEITGQTLSGKPINQAYFTGKVTLVNFMFVGCMPCMKEISVLNKLHFNNKATPAFQVLGVSANTAEQLNRFNAENDTTIYSRIRKIFKAAPIAYDLMPECEKRKPFPENSLGAECQVISRKFKTNGYPVSFLIDKKGTIRKVFPGFPMPKDALTFNEKGEMISVAEVNSEPFIKELQAEIDKLLSE